MRSGPTVWRLLVHIRAVDCASTRTGKACAAHGCAPAAEGAPERVAVPITAMNVSQTAGVQPAGATARVHQALPRVGAAHLKGALQQNH
jgi:hypothetical protein